MIQILLLLFSLPLFLSCASSSIRIPVEDLKAPQTLSRGWSHVESSTEVSQMPAGTPMVYYGEVELMDNLLIYTSERFGISVLNKYTGVLLWQKKIKEGSRSGIVFQGNTIYAGGNDGFFQAYHSKTGKEVWKTNVRYPVRGKPIIVGKKIFLSTVNHSIYALSLQTGKILWIYPHIADPAMRVRGGGNITYAYKRLWTGFDDGILLSLSLNDGKPLFKRSFPKKEEVKFSDLDASVLPWEKGLLVSHYSGKLYHLKKNGKILWSFPAGSAHAPAVKTGKDSRIYLASSDASIYALKGKGKLAWKYNLPTGVPTAIAYSKKRNIVLVLGSRSYVYALSGETGALLDTVFLGASSGSYGKIALDKKEEAFYLVSAYGRVHQILLGKFSPKEKARKKI